MKRTFPLVVLTSALLVTMAAPLQSQTSLAKAKTVVQEFAIAFALLPLTADDHEWVAVTFLWIAVVFTLVTGIQYLIDARRSDAV